MGSTDLTELSITLSWTLYPLLRCEGAKALCVAMLYEQALRRKDRAFVHSRREFWSRKSGLADRYDAVLCIIPLYLTSPGQDSPLIHLPLNFAFRRRCVDTSKLWEQLFNKISYNNINIIIIDIIIIIIQTHFCSEISEKNDSGKFNVVHIPCDRLTYSL